MSEAQIGNPRLIEAGRKVGLSNKGKQPWNHGRTFSEESKEKMRKAKIGKPLSEEHKAKIRLASRHSSKNKRKIQINGIEFESLTAAAKHFSKSITWVYNQLKKEQINE